MRRIIDAIKRLGNWLRRAWAAIRPGARAWNGAASGVFTLTVLVVGLFAIAGTLPAGGLYFLLFSCLLPALALLVAGIIRALLVGLHKATPRAYQWALLAALLLLSLLLWLNAVGQLVAIAVIVVIGSCIGAGVAALTGGRRRRLTRVQRVVALGAFVLGMSGLIGVTVWLLWDGPASEPPPNAAAAATARVTPLAAPDPSQRGAYTVATLTYGSGSDDRPEFGEDADLVTTPVDGAAFLEGWSGWRTRYLGFGPDALPRNATVWYPEGTGPFPLVLVVHGNHVQEELSDPGYAYLCEGLASRGFICASIDENFLNDSIIADPPGIGDLEEENDARGWLLLEHLRQWQAWHATPGTPFYRQVALDRVALIGHSRGGEAVAVAAAFNRLEHYPDDATVTFDYEFGIRSVVAIAPVDGQYLPAAKPLPLHNVNYLVLQGSHDMDVTSFDGYNTYGRVAFTGPEPQFKAAVYIYGANHGQFNSRWGRSDVLLPLIWLYNRRPLLAEADQQRAAQVFINAFLEATLHGDTRYVPLFQDVRYGAAWLPGTLYLHTYADASTRLVAAFEEDVDVTTTSAPGGRLEGRGLSIWREERVAMRRGRMDENSAVLLGWLGQEDAARYTLWLPGPIPGAGPESVLTFSLADANLSPDPTAGDKEHDSEESPALRDFTLEAEDREGQTARLPLSAFAPLQPQIEVQLLKAAFMTDLPRGEIVFQSYAFPLSAFAEVNPALDAAQLAAIHFIFDRSEEGVIVLDDIGFRDARLFAVEGE